MTYRNLRLWFSFFMLLIPVSSAQVQPEYRSVTPLTLTKISPKNYTNNQTNHSLSQMNSTILTKTSVIKIVNKTAYIVLFTFVQLCIVKPESCKNIATDFFNKINDVFSIQDLLKSPMKANQVIDNFIEVFYDGVSQNSWEDVIGIENAIDELKKILKIIHSENSFSKARRYGVSPPRNVLLVGPPGTGKTLLARAAASAINAPLLVVSASEIVKGKYAGVGVERVKNLFKHARFYAKKSKKNTAMIFIDELDSCGRSRGSDESSVSTDRDNTLNQLLVELDGFKARDESQPLIIVLAATNRKDILDSALLRKGRFDNIVKLDIPNLKGRENLFNHYIQKQRDIVSSKEIKFKNGPLTSDILCQTLNENYLSNCSNTTILKIINPIRAAGIKIPATLFSNLTAKMKLSDAQSILKFSNMNKTSNETYIPYKIEYQGTNIENNNIDYVKDLASMSAGLVGSDIASIVNEASILAMDQDRALPTKSDYFQALEDNILGKPIYSKNSIDKPAPDWRIAIHEAGHVLASFILENIDSATRASIVPRSGGSLGVTMFNVGDAKNLRALELRDRLVMMLAGKAAESHVFNGDSSTGAADDVQRSSQLAKAIVKQFAMEGIAHMINDDTSDIVVKDELVNAEKRALELIQNNNNTLYSLAYELMNKETLDETDLNIIIANSNKIITTKKGPIYPSEAFSNILEFIKTSKENSLQKSELPTRTRRNRAFVLIGLIVLSSSL